MVIYPDMNLPACCSIPKLWRDINTAKLQRWYLFIIRLPNLPTPINPDPGRILPFSTDGSQTLVAKWLKTNKVKKKKKNQAENDVNLLVSSDCIKCLQRTSSHWRSRTCSTPTDAPFITAPPTTLSIIHQSYARVFTFEAADQGHVARERCDTEAAHVTSLVQIGSDTCAESQPENTGWERQYLKYY